MIGQITASNDLEQLAPLSAQAGPRAIVEQPVAMAEHHAAEPLGGEAPVIGRQLGGAGLRAGVTSGGKNALRNAISLRM